MSRRIQRKRSYRTKLMLQTLQGSTAADSRGHTQRAFANKEPLWGAVETASGREGVLAREIQPEATHFVETDYTANAKPRARLKIESSGAVLNILSVDNVEQRDRTCQYVCEEVVST